jgi:8-oxo-dGTP pyrophosphatase MutT (NUDIX family)
MKKSAGLAVIWNNRLLLVHPTNASWKGQHSIPKGGIDKGETTLECAIRETHEEVGLLFKEEDIEPTEYCIDYKSKEGKTYKKVYYFIVRLEDKPDITRDMLQLDEVDWAGFIYPDKAKEIIFHRHRSILKHLQ